MRDPLLLLLRYRNLLISDLVVLSNLTNEVLMNKLSSVNEYISIRDREVIVTKPLDLALFLLKNGYSIKEVSKYIDWRDFEKVVSEILSLNNYFVLTNFRLNYPIKMEIDIIGVEPVSGRCLIIDCKHWSRGISRKSMVEIIDKHIDRISKFIKYFNLFKNKWSYFKYIRSIIPLIIILTTPYIRVYNNVLVVSIQELNNVLIDIHSIVELFSIEPFKLTN